MRFWKTVLAIVNGGLAMWLLAGLWHLVLAPGFYEKAQTPSHHEGGALILAAYGLLAVLMGWIYRAHLHHPGQGVGASILAGSKLGVFVGLLWVTPHALVRTGAHGGSMEYLLVNGLWHLVEQGFGGVVMGLLFASCSCSSATKGTGHTARAATS